ncbi:hypothetical protein H9I45_15125 [Polaribacter haliotis]|uniref:Uncharacterized protein n=1 Tax=Polaribacter haliotis TaxID=1888915 RepID=A0A7L8AF70_9FLAO|nr:hypothetical protein [Polaribacter haliotis]QOD60651.1 hypothetical protein H9I45_15125 [Polaribacter haliotis]
MAKAKLVKIEILEPVAGKYLMSANIGDVIEIDATQATVLVENNDAKFVK